MNIEVARLLRDVEVLMERQTGDRPMQANKALVLATLLNASAALMIAEVLKKLVESDLEQTVGGTE